MKKLLLFLAFAFFLYTFIQAQEYAQFEITGDDEGTGTFTNAALPNFRWEAFGAIYVIEVGNDEVFDDGNAFENTFGQANYEDNLRIQNYPNGEGTIGDTVTSISLLIITFDEPTPANSWGFCVTDIDVENCLFFAEDHNSDTVPPEIIDQWLVELFDCDPAEDGVNIPKWDPVNAALLGSDTPDDYVVYNNVVIGGMPSSEAPAAFIMPDIPLKKLAIRFENLQDVYFTSYHLYIASLHPSGANEQEKNFNTRVYPNPASDFLKIQSENFVDEACNVKICDLTGKILHEYIFNDGINTHTLDVGNLNPGIYFCKISCGTLTTTKKLIIN